MHVHVKLKHRHAQIVPNISLCYLHSDPKTHIWQITRKRERDRERERESSWLQWPAATYDRFLVMPTEKHDYTSPDNV